MQGSWAWVLLAGLAAGCESPAVEAPQTVAGGAIELRLAGVTARQYRGDELRLEFQADLLVINEQAGLLEASGAVRGRLEPDLWRRERP